MTKIQCSVEGCSSPSRNKSGLGLCEKHYMRMYRNGTLERINIAKPRTHSSGYKLIPSNGHPVAPNQSHAYEHRVIYYNKHGAGPFKCHWCSADLTWSTMHIDHLNDQKDDNRPENLVASCPVCNQARGRHKLIEIWKKKVGIDAFGQRKTKGQWARELGISTGSITCRLKAGWSLEDSLSRPRGKTGPKARPK